MIKENTIPPIEPKDVLSKALLTAADIMGIAQGDVGKVIGLSRSSIYRGINPDTKPGELAKMLIRCYRSLYVLVGGEPEDISHWMSMYNYHTQGIPAEQIKSIQGFVVVLTYLDAMRGKV